MNLATQPWIKTIDEHNQLIKCSLYDVLAQAHHIKTIQGGTPLEYAAVFRLILALLYRSSQPITEADASRLLNTGQFDPAPIRTYLAKWRDRFNLFDEHFPFFQWAQPPTQLKPRNINRLFLHYSTGIKGTLHSHVHDSTRLNLTPAQAARAVITAQNFLTSGGQSGRSGQMFRHTSPLRQTNFILQGRSLFETLWLHLFPKNSEQALSPFFSKAAPLPEDRPIWERDNPEIPQRCQPQGPMDALTYPCRIIKLLPESGQQVVNQTLISQSLWVAENAPLFDPLVAYRLVPGKKKGEKKVYPVKIEQGFMEELALFYPEVENLAFPVYTRWRRIVQQGYLNPNHTLFTAIGVECDKRRAARTHQIYNHYLPFPAAILVDAERFSLLQRYDREMQIWLQIGVKALQTGIQSLHKSRQNRFLSLPKLLRQTLQQIAENRLSLAVSGRDWPDWEQIVWQIVNRQLPVFPLEVRGRIMNKFNQLKNWQRKEKQNTDGEDDA